MIPLDEWIAGNLQAEGRFYNGGDNFAEWNPGTTRSYSNLAFGLLGLIVERVSGQAFNEYCRDHLFLPLGMTHTGWFLSEIDTADHVRPYGYLTDDNLDDYAEYLHLFPGAAFAPDQLVEACLYSFPNYPDGLVRTSVRELSYFLTAILNGGRLHDRRILQAATVDKMLTLQLADNDRQGLCFYKNKISDTLRLWGHNGGRSGHRDLLGIRPHPKDRHHHLPE